MRGMSTTIPAESPTLSVELTGLPVDADTRARMLENPGFGAIYGEHMVRIDYVAGDGWWRSRLQPYAPIQLEPATAVFHYAQAMFEGLKAYRLADGGVATFRPEANAARRISFAIRRCDRWFNQPCTLDNYGSG